MCSSDLDVWKWKDPMRDSSGTLMGAKRFLEDKIEELLLRDDEIGRASCRERV